MILDWYIVSNALDNYTQRKIENNKDFYNWKYIAFVLFEENASSRAYIKMKQKKAKQFWIETKVIEQVELSSEQKASWVIELLNNDEDCIWILVQLPINDNLKPYQGKILSKIHPKKDIDGLWWILFWLAQIESINFLPATPRAIFEILNFYKIPVAWENITIIWQSNLIWKPTATESMRQQATVFSFNQFSKKEDIKQACKNSSIIISATWNLHMIDETYLDNKKMQILIDVWWGKKDNKPTWDFNFEDINTKKHMYTPVPWGVWPVTVSSIFANLVDLQEIV